MMTLDEVSRLPVGGSVDPAGGEKLRDLDSFLRDEIAAAQAYRLAVTPSSEDPAETAFRGVLVQLQEEHDLAVEVFREFIVDTHGEPADRSGTWGIWANVVRRCTGGTEKAVEKDEPLPPLLELLRDAESLLLEGYIEGSTHIGAAAAMQFIKEQLIPSQQRHVRMLRLLLGEDQDG